MGRVLLLSNVLILGIILLAAVYTFSLSRSTHREQARHAAENLALTLSAGIAADIKQVDNVLLSTRAQLDRDRLSTTDLAFIGALAEHHRALVPQIDALRATNAAGEVLNADGQKVSVGDRDYFAAARAAPHKLAISEPLRGRIIQKWGLILARARTDVDGNFQGIVYSNLSTDHFHRLFKEVRLGDSGAVSLRTAALNLVARYAGGATVQDQAIGTNTVSPELRAALQQDARRGFYISRTAIDGVERANAYHQVPGYPLTVIVGLGTDEFYGPWRQEVAAIAGLTGLLVAIVLGLSVLVHRAHHDQLILHQSVHTLASEQQLLLENELVGMVRLRNRIEVWHNRALNDLFGYSAEELRGQPSRLLYRDGESHARVGQAYAALQKGEQVRTQLQMRHKNGSLLWIDLSGVQLPGGDSLWMMVDITPLKEREERARHMALHDELTGLVNRFGLESSVNEILQAARQDDHQVALCFVDLDGFKNVNDTYGHDAGDSLLRIAAQRIASCTRSHDMVIRLGGDEFVVVLTNLRDTTESEPVLRRILESLTTPFLVRKGVEVRIGASLGIALFPRDGERVDQLLSKADAAMYVAKRAGKGQFSFYGTA